MKLSIRTDSLTTPLFGVLLNLVCCLFSFFSARAQVDTTKTTDRTQEIEEVTVKAPEKKEMVFDDDTYYIIDFSITEHGKLLLLKHLRHYYVYHIADDFTTLFKLKLAFKPTALFDDCLGNTHVVTRDSMFQLAYSGDTVDIIERNSIMLYYHFFNHCKDHLESKALFVYLSDYNHTHQYLSHDLITEEEQTLYVIRDSVLIKSMLDESLIEDNGSGSMQESSVSEQALLRDYEERASFVRNVLIRPAYCPVFVQKDSIYIFDHINGYVIVEDCDGQIVRQVPISYNQEKNWYRRIYRDDAQDRFYAVYLKNGVQHLQRLNKCTFQTETDFPISKHAYPRKVMVYDGYAYYTYKPEVNANLNKLYRQRLF